ncbi:MAG: NAD(P)-dependent oxidoreductase [Alphaproteobacteria bacterium]|nr:NAD(P)-dependent oxidoreductase [Alphaproteobacteria bacterium]
MARVAFIGLGVMGYPMAGHLARVGHEVTVANRTQAKAATWIGEHPGRLAKTPKEAAANADFVFTCVGNDADLRNVALGKDGALASMTEGTVFIDHTTASAQIARELAEKGQAGGIGFLDAPVSGGEAGARQGLLSIMAGGHEGDFERAKPVMAAYGRTIEHMGNAGSGQLTKMVNQICVAGLLEALAEGLDFGERAGLDMEKVLSVITKGAAQSWQMENRSKTMLEGKFDFGFAVKWMRKDLDICFREAEKTGATLPVTKLVERFYAEIAEMGGERWDTSSLIARLKRGD